jgi:hypothetical protein
MVVLTRKDIREMRRNYIKVTAKQERELLKLLGHEPLEDGDRYCYSEQDIYEQTRIYLRDHPDVDPVEEEEMKRRILWLEGLEKKDKSQNGNINDLALNTQREGPRKGRRSSLTSRKGT